MLTNGNLEGGFRYYNGIGELELAEGWAPWYYEREGLHRPEYKPHTEDAYVHGGGYSQKMFTTWVAHHAGMVQSVQVEEGGWYRFTAWARSRSGESQEQYRYLLAVGANPYGAEPTDATGGLFNVLGRGDWTNDEWVKLTVTFQAWAPMVKVFTFGLAKYGLHWNDSYWDDMKLKRVTLQEPEPEPEPDPTPGCAYDEASLLAGVRAVVRAELDKTAIHAILSQSV